MAEPLISSNETSSRRIQKIVKEVLPKSQSNFSIEDEAAELLANYAEELARTVLESAASLAKIQNSSTIQDVDIALILAKKVGVEVAGHSISAKRTLHHNSLKSSLSVLSGLSGSGISFDDSRKKSRI